MKKSVRLFITGSVQTNFFNEFIKNSADPLKVRGFIRYLEDRRIEIFLEGDIASVEKMIEICKTGPQHSFIRSIEQKDERYQGFSDFKVLRI